MPGNWQNWANFAVRYRLGYRFPLRRREESPDSKEQCTGEEPGPLRLGGVEQIVPQKITATCLALGGTGSKGENVR
jgi:hypothetical protein